VSCGGAATGAGAGAGAGVAARAGVAAATRRPLPPFTPAHEALRAERRAWIAAELTPHVEGFRLIMVNFAWERLTMALGAVAAADAVFERTLAFVRERDAVAASSSRSRRVEHQRRASAATASFI
jgi:hypothetical protein